MEQFAGNWYIFYHTLMLQKTRGISGGYRGVQADEINVICENGTVTVENCRAGMKGVKPVASVDPYTEQSARSAAISSCAVNEQGIKAVKGDMMLVRNVDFGTGCKTAILRARGSGSVFLFADNMGNDPFVSMKVEEGEYVSLSGNASLDGVHDLIFVFDGDIELTAWQFE